MEYVIETKSLTKRFPRKVAAHDVEMHVEKGDIYGMIGKNGAGKTTTMKMILGMLEPTSGEIRLFGSSDLHKERARIGSLIEAPGGAEEAMANQISLEDMAGSDLVQPSGQAVAREVAETGEEGDR